MKYMGSKNRIAKHLLPIMLAEAEKHGITKWIEPFVGGANMIDKVPDTFERIGYDLNDHVIHALIGIRDFAYQFPEYITESEYNDLKGTKPCNIDSWIRIACSYGGIFESKLAADKVGIRNYAKEAKRNALKQSPKIQNVQFICDSYENLDFEDCLIYCFDTETEILTESGWKYVKDISVGERCLSREPNSNKLEYKDVCYTTKYHHEGEMFSYKSKMVDILVTPDHNLFINKKLGRGKVRKDMFIKPKDIENFNFQFVSAGGTWEDCGDIKCKVNGMDLCAKRFAYLLGIFLTDGSVNNQKSVTITQSKPQIVLKIREVLTELNIQFSEYIDKRGSSAFYLKKPFSKYFEDFYMKNTRRIPKYFLNHTKDVLLSLLEGLMDGDGDGRRIYLESRELAGDIQEVCYKVGKSSTLSKRKPTTQVLADGREIVGKKDYYCVSVNTSKYLSTDKKFGEFIQYDDMVYCVTLSEWHTVLTRRNGKCVWLGQCDPPYQDTSGYKTGSFDHDKFFDWCRKQSKKNIVFISEYNAPDDFIEVWQGEIKTNFASTRKKATHNAVEKLFRAG